MTFKSFRILTIIIKKTSDNEKLWSSNNHCKENVMMKTNI
jgi:hypothetical protein